eukprot:167522_1
MAASSDEKEDLENSDNEAEVPFDYQEYHDDSELNAFLEKEDLLSLQSGLSALNINIQYIYYVEPQQLNLLCDKLKLSIGSATRLQFSRAVVKLQEEYQSSKLRKKQTEREEKKQQPQAEPEITKMDTLGVDDKTKSTKHVYSTQSTSPRPMGYDYLIKCILLGDSHVGKSSLLLRYFDNDYKESQINTVGVDYRMKTIELGDYLVRYQIWDTAGQEKYRTIIAAYYRGIDAALICYDITNRESFENISIWVENIQEHTRTTDAVFMMLVGTKLDLVNDDEDTREVTTEEAKEMADEYCMKHCEVSSKSGHGVNSLFLTTASYAILNKKKKMDIIEKQRAITQEKIDMMQQEQEKIELETTETGKMGTDKFVKKKCCSFYI